MAAVLRAQPHGGCRDGEREHGTDYYFNGPISYSPTTGVLTIAPGAGGAEILSSSGLPAPLAVIPTTETNSNIPGSEVILSMSLVSGSVSDNGTYTSAAFSTATGYQAALYLGNGSGGTSTTPVLTGTLSNLLVAGYDGENFGVLTGYLHPTGGSAYSYFSDPSDLIALNFDLTTNFSGSMYESAFTGQINGQVESQTAVPLPGALPLLVGGIGLLGLSGPRRRRSVV